MLRTECDGDVSLRAEIDSFLAFENSAVDFIAEPAIASAAEFFADAVPLASVTGHLLGPYRLISELGHGGMGTVYLAERVDEYEKKVAIKVVRRGLAAEELLTRFRHERQILATLDHPNIAKLLDGGTTEDGSPFIVMDYIEGLPLDDYCQQHRPTINARLLLFSSVCSAVAYAHRNLVIHRDLKPSNIIVTADGIPKLLDFGIAKLLAPDSPFATEQTATIARVMTPQYASPEQIRGLHVTTASDIYSLGVLLYKLLSGVLPYQLKTLTPNEIEHVVCEKEAERPSTAANKQRLAKASGDDSPPVNPHALRGDLDNIVLMALRKEPERRYKSVYEFAEDIERHLDGLPVRARANTFAYRGGKFVRRHRVGVAATILIIVSLFGGIIATVRQSRATERERVKAETINTFLQSMLNASNPEAATRQGHDLTVKEVLDEASKRLATEDLSTQPEVKAELQRIVGTSYLSMGQYDLAEQNLKAALEAKTKLFGAENLETTKTLVSMADLWLAKGNYPQAAQFYRQRISILRSEQKAGHVDTDYLLSALYDFALLLRSQGDSRQAERLLRECLSLRSQASKEAQNVFSIYEGVLALTLADQGYFEEAKKIIAAQVEAARQEGYSAATALCANLTGLGSFQIETGEFKSAIAHLQEAETIYRRVYNHAYVPLGDNLRLQAQALVAEQNYVEAENKINEALEIYRATAGPKYVNYPTALLVHGIVFSHQGKTVEAEAAFRESVQLRAANLPEGHFLRAVADGVLGEFLTNQKRFAEAEPLLLGSYESLNHSQFIGSPRVRTAKVRLVVLYTNWGRPDDATRFNEGVLAPASS